MQWNCSNNGCFNQKHRLDFGVFYDSLPGRISFTDIDGIVEVSGYALMLEWKSNPGELKTGQRIMFERITRQEKVSVLCLAGDAETMTVTHCAGYFDGKKVIEWEPCDLTKANALIREWVSWAQSQPWQRPAQ